VTTLETRKTDEEERRDLRERRVEADGSKTLKRKKKW